MAVKRVIIVDEENEGTDFVGMLRLSNEALALPEHKFEGVLDATVNGLVVDLKHAIREEWIKRAREIAGLGN